MSKEIITNKQGACIIVMFLVGSTLVVGISGEAKQDVWIAAIIATIMSLPMLFVYSRLLNLFPGKDLIDILEAVFGRVFGKLISLLFIWYFFHLGALVIRNFTEFVNIVSFPETPQMILNICIGLLCIWVVRAGIEVIARGSALVLPSLVVILVVVNLLGIGNMHIINLRPVLYNGIKPVLITAFSVFSFPLAETVVFTMILGSLKDNRKVFRVLLITTLIGMVIITLSALRNILILGPDISSDIYFPSYIATRTINIGEIIQRFEVLIVITFLNAGFVKVSVCLYAVSKGLAKVLNIKRYEEIVAPAGLLMMNLASIIYESAFEMFDWATKIYQYYALPFQVLLPIIILITAEVKIRTKNLRPEEQG